VRDRNRWIALVVLCTGMLMIVLDMTIVNVALPSIQADLGAGYRAGADVPGALLITGAMMLGVFTIVDPAAQQGWLAARTLSLGTGSLALLGAFIVRQKTARHPLMPLRIFSSRAVTGANLVQVLGTAGMFGMFFLGSLYRAGPVRHDPARRDVPELRLPGHAADRHRRWPVLPRAHDAGHVQCHAAGCRPGLRSGKHYGPGRRCARARRAGHRAASRTNALIAQGRPVAVALTDGYHLTLRTWPE